MTRMVGVMALVAVMVSLAAGCSGGSGTDGTLSAPPATTATMTASAVSEESVGQAPAVIADGRHPVIVKSVDSARPAITFDLVVFLTGEAAKTEFHKRHPDEEGPMNDYFIVNDNPKLRTVPVASSATIRLLPGDGSVTLVDTTLDQLAADAAERLCWITVSDGSIVLVEEQFVP